MVSSNAFSTSSKCPRHEVRKQRAGCRFERRLRRRRTDWIRVNRCDAVELVEHDHHRHRRFREPRDQFNRTEPVLPPLMNLLDRQVHAGLLIELLFQIRQHRDRDDRPQVVVEIARGVHEAAGREVRQKRARRRFDRRLQPRSRSNSEQRGQQEGGDDFHAPNGTSRPGSLPGRLVVAVYDAGGGGGGGGGPRPIMAVVRSVRRSAMRFSGGIFGVFFFTAAVNAATFGYVAAYVFAPLL